MPGQIGHSEQQIADFFFQLFRGGVAGFHDFVSLFGDLFDHLGGIIPVEPDACGALLKFQSTQQRGQGAGHVVEQAGAGRSLRGALLFLVLLPRNSLCLGGLHFRPGPKDMRVAAEHLLVDGGDNIGEIEELFLLRHARMEHDLEEKVAQLVLQLRPVLVLDRAGDFVSFLNGIGRDAGKILLKVPRAAAVGIAQAAHDVEQGGNVFGHANSE